MIDALALFTIILIIAIFIKLLNCASSRSKRVKTLVTSLKKLIYWNAFIRLFIEEYQVIVIACLIRMYAVDFSTAFEGFSTIFGVIGMVIVLMCPIAVWKFLFGHFKRNDFSDSYGSLFSDLQVHDSKAMLFNVAFMIRRIVIAFLIVSLSDYNYFQT